jgi:primosomal protein N' (replication factor Y)
MEQVSGRAGRRDSAGKVMIQTTNPSHPVIEHVKRHDYVGMYLEEIEKRRQFMYPPFSKIIHLSFRHKDRNIVRDAAHSFAQAIDLVYGKFVVGPAEPIVSRVRNLFLMELLLKLPKDGSFLARCKADLLKQIVALHAEKNFRTVLVVPDVDIV